MRPLLLALLLGLLPLGSLGQAPSRPPSARDCSQAPDPARCEARRQKAREAREAARRACGDKRGAEGRDCRIREHCARAQHPQRCEQRARERAERRREAAAACKGRPAEELRRCVRERLGQRPAPRG